MLVHPGAVSTAIARSAHPSRYLDEAAVAEAVAAFERVMRVHREMPGRYWSLIGRAMGRT